MTNLHEQLIEDNVRSEWVDYNGHMNDAAYVEVFSMAVDRLMEVIGIDAKFRENYGYSIYTLENHICYLNEANEGQPLVVKSQLLDCDAKKLHMFFIMEDSAGESIATSEQMLIGMDMNEGRPAPFPSPVDAKVEEMSKRDKDKPVPDKAGRRIGIRKKK